MAVESNPPMLEYEGFGEIALETVAHEGSQSTAEELASGMVRGAFFVWSLKRRAVASAPRDSLGTTSY